MDIETKPPQPKNGPDFDPQKKPPKMELLREDLSVFNSIINNKEFQIIYERELGHQLLLNRAEADEDYILSDKSNEKDPSDIMIEQIAVQLSQWETLAERNLSKLTAEELRGIQENMKKLDSFIEKMREKEVFSAAEAETLNAQLEAIRLTYLHETIRR